MRASIGSTPPTPRTMNHSAPTVVDVVYRPRHAHAAPFRLVAVVKLATPVPGNEYEEDITKINVERPPLPTIARFHKTCSTAMTPPLLFLFAVPLIPTSPSSPLIILITVQDGVCGKDPFP